MEEFDSLDGWEESTADSQNYLESLGIGSD